MAQACPVVQVPCLPVSEALREGGEGGARAGGGPVSGSVGGSGAPRSQEEEPVKRLGGRPSGPLWGFERKLLAGVEQVGRVPAELTVTSGMGEDRSWRRATAAGTGAAGTVGGPGGAGCPAQGADVGTGYEEGPGARTPMALWLGQVRG